MVWPYLCNETRPLLRLDICLGRVADVFGLVFSILFLLGSEFSVLIIRGSLVHALFSQQLYSINQF